MKNEKTNEKTNQMKVSGQGSIYISNDMIRINDTDLLEEILNRLPTNRWNEAEFHGSIRIEIEVMPETLSFEDGAGKDFAPLDKTMPDLDAALAEA